LTLECRENNLLMRTHLDSSMDQPGQTEYHPTRYVRDNACQMGGKVWEVRRTVGVIVIKRELKAPRTGKGARAIVVRRQNKESRRDGRGRIA